LVEWVGSFGEERREVEEERREEKRRGEVEKAAALPFPKLFTPSPLHTVSAYLAPVLCRTYCTVAETLVACAASGQPRKKTASHSSPPPGTNCLPRPTRSVQPQPPSALLRAGVTLSLPIHSGPALSSSAVHDWPGCCCVHPFPAPCSSTTSNASKSSPPLPSPHLNSPPPPPLAHALHPSYALH
jgi:hypothetical protein